MQRVVTETVKRFLLLWLPFCFIVPVYAQEDMLDPNFDNATPAAANTVQNAVIEGVQISSEPGKEKGESVITCYFIFRDKPSSYFYEIKKRAKKLVFEFNDTQKGTSPVPSQKQDPILGFEVEQRKVDVNKEVKGLNPEWHDLVSVTFSLDAIPIVNVSDEYNVISFTYKWSTDPANAAKYAVKEEKSNPVVWWGIGGGVALLGGLAIAVLVQPPPPSRPDSPLDTADLPGHVLQLF